MYYINGQYVAKTEAKISIFDLAILRGFAVFDFLRVYCNEPFHFQDHLDRLRYSAETIGLKLSHSPEEIEEIVAHLLQANPLNGEANVKIIVSGGISGDQLQPTAESSLIMMAYPPMHHPEHHYTEGIKAITTRLSRSFPTSKTIQYIPAIVALQEGKPQGALEALYTNAEDEILEATTCNFFAFKKGILYTCASDEILFGITREVVLRLSAPHFEIALRPITLADLPSLDEAFITGSNREIMPISHIDSIPIGSGKPGPNTQFLKNLFKTYVQNHHWPRLHIPRYAIKHFSTR